MDTDALIAQRASTHGDFRDNARVSRAIKHLFNKSRMTTLNDFQAEGLDMIAFKVSRILTGSADYVDNWDDIAGYAKRVADFLREGNSSPHRTT